MKRRSFLGGLGATAIATSLKAAASSGGRYAKIVPEIWVPVNNAPVHSKAVVIGSGFGGAISALRLTQANMNVTMLERGFQWPNDPWRDIFANDTLPDGRGYWFRKSSGSVFSNLSLPIDSFGGVMDITQYPNMSVWRGACVGGGSVVFTGAMPQPAQVYFDQLFNGSVSYEEMDSIYYPRVKAMLKLSPMPTDIYNSAPFGHSRTWDANVKKAGYTSKPVDGIWNWNTVRAELNGASRPSCTIGRSNLGNSNGAKYDLNQNYLAQAKATGRLSVYTGHVVKSIGYNGSVYTIDVQKIAPDGTVLDSYSITADMVFLAAGSIGTSELLTRARALNTLPNLNQYVGQGWGTNGDASVVRSFAFAQGFTTGAACASMIHDPYVTEPCTLESWFPPAVPVNLEIGGSLGMTFDLTNRGSFSYTKASDSVTLNWAASGNNSAKAAERAMNNKIAAASGTIPGVPLVISDVFNSFTAHPLGGAVLNQVTDNYGRVKGYKGLYVMDGAVIPGNTGAVNPSFTISALAERNIEQIVKAGG